MSDITKLLDSLKAVALSDLHTEVKPAIASAVTGILTSPSGFSLAAEAARLGGEMIATGKDLLIDEGKAVLQWGLTEMGKV